MFDDLVEGNDAHAAGFVDVGLGPRPARRLAIVTCMDVRVDPLAMSGSRLGDAHVVRNAGGRVTSDVVRSIVVGVELLGVERVAVVQHTDCGMAGVTDDELGELVASRRGVDEVPFEFFTIDDQEQTLTGDVESLRHAEVLAGAVEVAGFVYDVRTGRLRRVC